MLTMSISADAKGEVAEMAITLETRYTPEVEEATRAAWERVKAFIPEVEWRLYAPLIHEINRLKVEKKAVILAHNYMTPEIFHGVADVVGDSLALAREATKVDAETIVMCGVHFMAETAKILNPEKTVLIADLRAGCSLAESITGQDVRNLRQQYPGVPIVTYVNTSAEVKAESDICCTSGNVVEIVKSLDAPRVLCIPDRYLARWVQTQTPDIEILTWEPGRCIVHEQFTARDLRDYREQFPGITLLAHPECPPDVIAEADHTGSTAGMIQYLRVHQPKKVAMITECSMSDNVAHEFPETDFIRPCTVCPHMKRITLEGIRDALLHRKHEIHVDPDTAARARQAVERMLAVR